MIIVIVLILIGVIAVIRSVVNLPDRIGACKNRHQRQCCHDQAENCQNRFFYLFAPGSFLIIGGVIFGWAAGRCRSFRLLVCFLHCHSFLHLLVKFVDRIGFIGSLVTYCPGTVLFILIDYEGAIGLILVNTEGFRALVILSDKGPHVLQRKVHLLCPGFQFLDCLWYTVGMAVVIVVDTATVRADLIKIVDPAAAPVAFYLHVPLLKIHVAIVSVLLYHVLHLLPT